MADGTEALLNDEQRRERLTVEALGHAGKAIVASKARVAYVERLECKWCDEMMELVTAVCRSTWGSGRRDETFEDELRRFSEMCGYRPLGRRPHEA